MKKILILLLILLGAFIVYVIFYYSHKREEIYLLPNNFKGTVVIIYDVKDGAPEKYENGKRVYEIPANGILKTQFKLKAGVYPSPQYFYVEENVRVRQLSYEWQPQKDTYNDVRVFGGKSGTAEANYSKKTVAFESFFVGKKSDADSLYKARDNMSIADL